MFTLGARAQLSLQGTIMWTHRLFKGPNPHRARVQGRDLVLRHKVGVNILGTQCLNTFRVGAQALVLGHQVWTWCLLSSGSFSKVLEFLVSRRQTFVAGATSSLYSYNLIYASRDDKQNLKRTLRLPPGTNPPTQSPATRPPATSQPPGAGVGEWIHWTQIVKKHKDEQMKNNRTRAQRDMGLVPQSSIRLTAD